LDSQEELLNEFVKGPSKSAIVEEQCHIIGPISKDDSFLNSRVKLNKHGLEFVDL